MSIQADSVLTAIPADGNPEPEPFYGLLAFARDLHRERCRSHQQVLEATMETLQAEEAE